MDRYEGQYVAIVGAAVVAHGRDAKLVYEIARRKHPDRRILIGQVPVREAMILWVESVSHSREYIQRATAISSSDCFRMRPVMVRNQNSL